MQSRRDPLRPNRGKSPDLDETAGGRPERLRHPSRVTGRRVGREAVKEKELRVIMGRWAGRVCGLHANLAGVDGLAPRRPDPAGAVDGDRDDRHLAGDRDDEGTVFELPDGAVGGDSALRVDQQRVPGRQIPDGIGIDLAEVRESAVHLDHPDRAHDRAEHRDAEQFTHGQHPQRHPATHLSGRGSRATPRGGRRRGRSRRTRPVTARRSCRPASPASTPGRPRRCRTPAGGRRTPEATRASC